MKTNFPASFVLGFAALTGSVWAQNVTTEAPTVNVAAPRALVPDQTIFSSRLPAPVELTQAAAAQGLGVERIEQTNGQVIVVYKFSDGQLKTIAYQLLPAAAAAPTTPAPVVIPAPATPAPTVVYEMAPRIVYAAPDYYAYSYPRVWSPPVSVRLGFGWGYYGGGRGHWGHR